MKIEYIIVLLLGYPVLFKMYVSARDELIATLKDVLPLADDLVKFLDLLERKHEQVRPRPNKGEDKKDKDADTSNDHH